MATSIDEERIKIDRMPLTVRFNLIPHLNAVDGYVIDSMGRNRGNFLMGFSGGDFDWEFRRFLKKFTGRDWSNATLRG